jgi:hypothetical protein
MLAGLIIVASALSFVFMMADYWSPGRIVALTAIFGFGIGVVWLWDELRSER